MRLDKFICEKFNISRSKAQQMIKNQLIYVKEQMVDKVSFEVDNQDEIVVKEHKNYVSRGAYKLLGAIQDFKLNFNDKIVLDIGASTGGFTEVALEHGAKKVYSVDIGKDELDESLRENKKVVNLSGIDFRELVFDRCFDVNFIVGDISFISLKNIFPKIIELFGNKIEICILFKPQFECGKDLAKKYKGVVKNRAIHIKLLKDFCSYLQSSNFVISGLTYSKIKGKSGNIEYLFYLNGENTIPFEIDSVVENAFSVL